MEEPRRLIFTAAPIICLFVLSLVYVEFFSQKKMSLPKWSVYKVDHVTSEQLEMTESHRLLLGRLVRGHDRMELEATGVACNSGIHSVICVANKPARIDASTLEIHIAPDQSKQGAIGKKRVIRPYARQDDEYTMKFVSPVHMLRLNTTPPACNYTYDVPAVIFSSGGFTGNLFHEFNEVIIPLFITTRHFQANVVFVVTDYKPWFVSKYNRVLSHLSKYEVINLAANKSVHCFPGAVVGLKYHDNLALNSSEIPGGYSMADFKLFLNQAYSLKINNESEIPKPVLILISRPRSRRFLNEDEMVDMMEHDLGFRVIVVRGNRMSNLDKLSTVLNSGSVMVGAHGAGLTNEIFLPAGAVMVQVAPLGLEWACHTYYGDPAPAMGVQYLEYKIKPEESSLLDKYGADHPIIADPASIFAKGYRAARAVYIDEQNLKVNVTRFRQTLIQALKLLRRVPEAFH